MHTHILYSKYNICKLVAYSLFPVQKTSKRFQIMLCITNLAIVALFWSKFYAIKYIFVYNFKVFLIFLRLTM